MQNNSNNHLSHYNIRPSVSLSSLMIGLGIFISQTISPAYSAYDMTQQQYYPSLTGQYSNIRLVPRPILNNPCIIGTIYANSANNDEILFCQNDASNPGTGIWGRIPGFWRQIRNVLYTIDTNPNLTTTIGSTTPKFKLTLDGDGGIMAKGTFGNGVTLNSTGPGARLMWYPRKAAFRAGELTNMVPNGWNDANIGSHSVVAGGLDNIASGDFSGVGGGTLNSALANYSTIGGGRKNLIDPAATFATIGGGGSTFGTIGDDAGNTVFGIGGFVGSGESNITGTAGDAVNSTDAAICGGIENQALKTYSVACTGGKNISQNLASSICGGAFNLADGQWSTVAASGITSSSISTNAQGDYSFVAGGFGNISSGTYSTIGLGKSNWSSGDSPNNAAADYSAIITGNNNITLATALNSVIVSGENNTAGGQYSVIPTGLNNTVLGDYSLAMGKNMFLETTKNRSFVWGHSNTSVNLNQPGGFIIYSGNVGIGVLSPSEKLDISQNLLVKGTGKSIILSNPPTVAGNDALRWPNATSIIGLDMAEIFETSEPVEPADVLIIDSQKTAKLRKSQHSYDTKVVGIVSSNPAVLLNDNHMTISPTIDIPAQEDQAAVALAGRVHCKVTDQGGAIAVGDLLTTSDMRGHAMKASNRAKSKGAIIGKALEPFSFSSGNKQGIIAVFVDLQ
jgi:hypothetical protein